MDDKIIEKCPKCSSDLTFVSGKKKNIVCPNCGKRLRFNGKKISSIGKNYLLITRGFLFLLSFLLSVPIFVLIVTYVYPAFWVKWYYSLALLFVIFNLLVFLIKRYKIVTSIFSVVLIGAISISSYNHIYDFNDFCEDYKYLLKGFYNKMPSIKSDDENTEKILMLNKPMPLRVNIKKAILINDKLVEDYALRSAKIYFEKEQIDYRLNAKILRLIQVFSIYKETKNKWNYNKYLPKVSNILPPSESFKLMGGNDLNFSIFLANCFKSIGSNSRIVYTLTGNYYIEVLLTDFSEYKLVKKLIVENLFVDDIKGREVEYSKSKDGFIWIRLDVNSDFPGENMYQKLLNDYLKI